MNFELPLLTQAHHCLAFSMDPSGPAQPSLDTAYTTQGNPADQSAAERGDAASNAARAHQGDLVEARERGDIPVPSTHNQGATPSSLGYGARDASGDRTDVRYAEAAPD